MVQCKTLYVCKTINRYIIGFRTVLREKRRRDRSPGEAEVKNEALYLPSSIASAQDIHIPQRGKNASARVSITMAERKLN